jgi:predicted DNA-binding transcriptional regulator YafY
MRSPTTRVLAVLELLQAHGRLSGTELAQRLGVDGRTLRRYIARLEELGIPVVAERGRYGNYSLIAGYKLPPMMFSDDEALALSIGLVAARGLGLAGSAPAVQSAQAKLERVMPGPLKHRIRALAETVSLDFGRPIGPGDNAALLALSTAAHGWQRVHMRYRSAQGDDTEREFDPYGLAWRAGRWYTVGMCHLRKDLRSFRVDRVMSVKAVNAVFKPPADFDAVRHLALGIATLPRSISVQVLLHTTLETAQEQLFSAIGVYQPHKKGLVLHSQADDLEWYARQLARLECRFEVISPPALKAAVTRHARRLLKFAA